MKYGIVKRLMFLLMSFILIFAGLPIDMFYKVSAHDGNIHSENKEDKENKKNNENTKIRSVEKVDELIEKRGANSKTYRNSDFSLTSEVFTGAVHYQTEDGKMKEIKNHIKENSGSDKKDFKYKTTENRFSVKIAEKTGKKELVSLSFGKDRLSFGLDTQKEASVSFQEDTIVYKNIAKDTDIQYTVLPNGLKEDIILHSNQARTSFLFPINGTLTARQSGKNIEFVNKDNKILWVMSPPFMEDSNGVFSHDISYSIETIKGKQAIRLEVSEEYVKDSSRKFPIVVDPTVTLGGSSTNTGDSYVLKAYPGNNYNTTPELRTGYTSSTSTTRSFLKFDGSLPDLKGGLLVKAELKAYKHANSGEPISTDVYVQKLNSSWSDTTITWNNQPTIDTTKTYASADADGSAGTLTWDLTNLVDSWYKGTANYGIVLRSTSEGTAGTYRKFNASESSSGQPYLSITHSDVPTAPTGTAYGNGANSGTGYINLNWTSVPGATGYKVLIYNGSGRQEFDVKNTTTWTTKGKNIWPKDGTCNLKTDGTGGEFVDDPRAHYAKCGNNYPNNKNYWFRIKAYNNYGTTTESAAFTPTIPDQTAPTTPGKPSNSNALNSKFTWSWAASTDNNSGMKGYYVYVGTTPGGTNVVNGAFTSTNSYTHSTTLSPRTTYYAHVKAVDNNNNISVASSGSNASVARLQNDASISAYSIPNPMEAGSSYTVYVTVKNEGLSTWTSSGNYKLGAMGDSDPFATNRQVLAGTDSIAPGASKQFNFNMKAGTKLGAFTTDWRMVIDTTTPTWFGDSLSRSVTVQDTKPPSGSIVIMEGKPYTNKLGVNLTLSSTDSGSGVTNMHFSNDNAAWSAWEAFNTSKAWTLSSGDGTKSVYVQYRDAGGNISASASDTIILDTKKPTATISSPNKDSYLQGSVSIKGSALDENFKSYLIEYGVGESPAQWTIINSKTTAVSENVLGTWDLSKLPTGRYTLRLSATDQAENSIAHTILVWVDQSQDYFGSEPYWGMHENMSGYGKSYVNLANGNLVIDHTDLKVPSRGLNLNVNRTYNSLDNFEGPLGIGWQSNLFETVTENSDGSAVYRTGDGTEHRFILQNGNYVAPKGLQLKLTKNPAGWKIESLSEITTVFDTTGKPVKNSDKNSNEIVYNYNTSGQLVEMVDSVGRKLSFVYSNGKLTSITDSSGRKIEYQYNGSQLISITKKNPDSTLFSKELYSYDSQGRLIESTNPNGKKTNYSYLGVRLNKISQPVTFYKVHNVSDADSIPTTTDTFIQEYNYDLSIGVVRVSYGTSTRMSHLAYTVNEHGNPVKIVIDPDAESITTVKKWVNNLLDTETDPNGNKTSFEYNQDGLLTKKIEPETVVNGEVQTHITTWNYQTGTERLLETKDALGRVTRHYYDARGNRIKTIDAAGQTFHYEFDANGNLVQELDERGPLYETFENFSFEKESEQNIPGWSLSGDSSIDSTVGYDGAQSLKLNSEGSAIAKALALDRTIKTAAIVADVKSEELTTGGLSFIAKFYDESQNVIEEKRVIGLEDNTGWRTVYGLVDVPVNAASMEMKVQLQGGGTAWIDAVRVEVGNVIKKNTYTSDGLYLTGITDSLGNTESYVYDAMGNKKKVTNARGFYTERTYDFEGNVLTEKTQRNAAESNTKAFVYDAVGNLKTETDALGNTTRYTYDELNRLVITRLPDVTQTDFGYDESSTPVTVIDKPFSAQQYDGLGNSIFERDRKGRITEHRYDNAGRKSSVIDPAGNKVVKVYDTNGNTLSESTFVTDVKKGTVEYGYDALNRLIWETDPVLKDEEGKSIRTIENTYDAVGNVVLTKDGSGAWVKTIYDKLNRPVNTIDSSTPAVRTWTLYNGLSQPFLLRDSLGENTSYHDKNGQLIRVSDASNQENQYMYDETGNKITWKESGGRYTEYQYSGDNLLISEKQKYTDAGQVKIQSIKYKYNQNGQLTNKILHTVQSDDSEVGQQETNYGYDQLGRLQFETSKDLTKSDKNVTEQKYLYDLEDNVVKKWIKDEMAEVPVYVAPDGVYRNTETFDYDVLDRFDDTSISHTNSETYFRYDDLNNTFTATNHVGTTTLTYDDGNRLIRTVGINGDSFTYSYHGNGMVKSVEGPGFKTNFEYNGSNKFDSIKSSIQDLRYEYDETERITAIYEGSHQLGKYTYTSLGKLKTSNENGKKLIYSYDENHNLIKIEEETTNGVIQPVKIYHYNEANQVGSIELYVNGSKTATHDYLYNASGTLSSETITEKGLVTRKNFGYNAKNQLISYEKTVDGQTIDVINYEYESGGSRLAKNISNSHYHYHIENGRVVYETIAKDGINPSTTKYQYDDKGFLLGFIKEGTPYYYHFNHRGDVVAISNADGEKVVGYAYDTWGNILETTGNQELADSNPYRYVGQYGVRYDKDTGMYLMTWRDYDPQIGRFIAPDTYAGEEDTPITQNRYLYANADPLNQIDPGGFRSHKPHQIFKEGGWPRTSTGIRVPKSKIKNKGKKSAKDIVFSDKFKKPAYKNQPYDRGWTKESIANTINKPYKIAKSKNKYTGNSVTVYYKNKTHYVAVDNGTGKVIQVSNLKKSNWKFDPTFSQ